MGKVADELLLASCKAIPENLLKAGYQFMHSDIEEEINHLLE
jgi:NAD dependent epimerase/dehydratase family enzyme